jgi:hypothetical protein
MTDPAGTTSAPRLTGDQLTTLLALLKEADSVELKLTLPESLRRSAVSALEMDPLDAQIRQVFFFDTPDLTLDKAGVVVRARRTQGRPNDSVIKLRPVDPADLPPDVRSSPDFVVEVDAMQSGFVCSGSYKGVLSGDVVPSVVKRDKAIHKLFNREQRAFYEEHAPSGVTLDDLSILGPINVAKLKFAPTGYDRRMVAELWQYPDGSQIVELSTKCAPNDAFNVVMESRAFLFERGIEPTGGGHTKTRTALDFFARELAGDSDS